MGTFIVGTILVCVVGLILRTMYKNRKNHKGCGDCSHCGGNCGCGGGCH